MGFDYGICACVLTLLMFCIIWLLICIRGDRAIKMDAGKLPDDFFKVFGYITVYWWCEDDCLYIKVGYAELGTRFSHGCPEWTIHKEDYDDHWSQNEHLQQPSFHICLDGVMHLKVILSSEFRDMVHSLMEKVHIVVIEWCCDFV